MPYLDVIAAAGTFRPAFGRLSGLGEYAMIEAAARNQWIDRSG